MTQEKKTDRHKSPKSEHTSSHGRERHSNSSNSDTVGERPTAVKAAGRSNAQMQRALLARTNAAASASKAPTGDTFSGEQGAAGLSRQGNGLAGGLRISQPSDPLEREAERIASQVVNDSTPGPTPQASGAGASHADKAVHRAPAPGGARTPKPAGVGSSSGRPLRDNTRSFFEGKFKRDLSQVRVHTEQRDAASAAQLQARAFTVGEDIFFGKRQFNPDSRKGKKLLAHELTHVVQQSNPPSLHAGASAGLDNAPEISSSGRPEIHRQDEDYLDNPDVPEGFRFVPDPDQALVPTDDDDIAELETEILGLEERFDYHLHDNNPDLFFVRGTLSRRAMAEGLFGDETMVESFDYVGLNIGGEMERGVRVRDASQLKPELLTTLRTHLDRVVESDADWPCGQNTHAASRW